MAQQDIDHLASRVKSLELQLKALKAQLANDQTESLASLHGMLRGQCNSTEADIARATYRLPDKLS